MEFKLNLRELSIIIMLVLATGIAGGWMGFLLFGDIAGSCKVVFIGKERMMELEQERIKSRKDSEDRKDSNDSKDSKDSKQSMFYGKPELALRIMEEVASKFNNRQTKVLFVSSQTGSVKGGFNITDEVHQSVIELLAQEQDKSK